MVPTSLLFIGLLPAAMAWGTLAARSAAFVAQDFMLPAAKATCQTLLGDTSSNYLVNAATWGASYAKTSAGNWTIGYHSMLANDNPPTSCNVSFARDCRAGNCITNSIANWTEIIGDSGKTQAEHTMALYMLISLVSDVTLPVNNDIHNGTTVNVKFNGVKTTLYNAWNSLMPIAVAGGSAESNSQSFAKRLAGNLTATKSTLFTTGEKTTWLQDLSLCYTVHAADLWSSDANAFMCNTVMPNGTAVLSGKEINGTYYKSAVPVLETQIAKAGYRLAAWLNLALVGQPGLTVPNNATVPMCNTTALTQGGTSVATTPSS